MKTNLLFFLFVVLLSLNSILCRNSKKTRSVSSFSQTDAREKAFISAIAYCSNINQIMNWTCLPCQNVSSMQPISVFSSVVTSTAGFVSIRKQPQTSIVYVVFRGTTPNHPLNWLTDLEAEPLQAFASKFNGNVHSGFYGAYLSVRPSLISGIQTAIKTILAWDSSVNIEIHFTGHSLGSALATVAVVDLRDNFQNIPFNLLTFGSPRVGNQEFAKSVASAVTQAYRVVHQADPVPHIPGNTFNWNYAHVDQEIFYDQTFSTYKPCNLGEDPSCSKKFKFWQYNLNDHLEYFGIRVGRYCG